MLAIMKWNFRLGGTVQKKRALYIDLCRRQAFNYKFYHIRISLEETALVVLDTSKVLRQLGSQAQAEDKALFEDFMIH